MGGLRELHLCISSRKKLYNQTTGFWSSKVGYTAGNLGRANLSTTLALLSGVCEQLLKSYSDFSDPRADTSLWKVSRNRASAEDTAAGWDQGCIPISKAYRSSWNIVDITKNWKQRLWFWPFYLGKYVTSKKEIEYCPSLEVSFRHRGIFVCQRDQGRAAGSREKVGDWQCATQPNFRTKDMTQM